MNASRSRALSVMTAVVLATTAPAFAQEINRASFNEDGSVN